MSVPISTKMLRLSSLVRHTASKSTNFLAKCPSGITLDYKPIITRVVRCYGSSDIYTHTTIINMETPSPGMHISNYMRHDHWIYK